MCKEETIKDLPKRCSKRYNHNKNVCHVYIKGSRTSQPKGVTTNIGNNSIKKYMDNSSSSIHRKYNNSGYETIKIKCNGKMVTPKGKGKRVTDDYQKGKKIE